MSAKVAILLSSYNGADYIEEQIESILKQDYTDFDLIIRDDGSTDNTISIIKKILNEHDNVILIKGNNIGLVKSFFYLLEYAYTKKYDYYAFSDQDDVWLPDKISTAITKLQKCNNSTTPLLYSCTSSLVDRNLRSVGKTTEKQNKKITFFNTAIQNICPGHNQVLNKKLVQVLISANQNLEKIYSQDLWISNAAAVTGKILFDNTYHTLYRMHGNNELGYGKGNLGRLRGHLKRLHKNETQKMAIQLKVFSECFKKFLSNGEQNEISLFFASQNSIVSRARYMIHTKLYRQSSKETLMFKCLYLLGKYNIYNI